MRDAGGKETESLSFLDVNALPCDEKDAIVKVLEVSGDKAIGSRFFYYVKQTANGSFFDKKENKLTDKANTTHESKFKFKLVTKAAFDHYVKYLQTGHNRFLICAEREM